MKTPQLVNKRPMAVRVAPVLFLILFLPGCLQAMPGDDDGPRDLEGHRATYRAMDEPGIKSRVLQYTILHANDSGYLIHVRHAGESQADYLYDVDREGFMRHDVELCGGRSPEGECPWGDYHQLETWGRGWPFLCGALIPEPGTYARTGVAGHDVEASLAHSSQGHRTVTIAVDQVPRFACTHSGPYPPARITTDAPPPGTYRGMLLQSGDAPFGLPAPQSRTATAPLLERNPTILLDETPETSILSANDVVRVLREDSVSFNSFIDANPSGINPVVNIFRSSGQVTIGPTTGPVQQEFAREQHHARQLVFYGRDTRDIYRGVVQGAQVRTAGVDATLPSESWVITEEDRSAHGYQAWSPLTDTDGEIWSPRFQLNEAMVSAQGLGIVGGRLVSAGYLPTWSEPYDGEVETLDACVTSTDDRTSGILLYTESLCISTATGEITQAEGDWDFVRRAAGLPDLDWEALIR